MDGKQSAEVVIIGLGPVGAVAANLAGAAGFDTLVIDRDAAPFALPRAIVFDAEIMRIFDSIGLADELAQITRPLGGSVYLGTDHRPIRVFRSPGPAHAHAWAPSNLFYQPQLETAIRKGMSRFPNVRVRSGCEVTELKAGSEGAVLQVSDPSGGKFEVEARIVLGCDGASSSTRKRLGLRLHDIGFLERWLVIDAHMHGPMRWPDTHEIPPEVRDGRYSLMVCDPEQPATLIPGVGTHRRWEYMLMPHERDEDAVEPGRLTQRISGWADPADVEIVRSSVYRFRALVADQWRSGPVFLLGDAAHQTPPFFGQGMCHGIRDAAQLMWKLALVLGGHARDALLDTYQPEREPHVREIISASVKAGAAVCITDPERARARDAEFRAAEAARGSAAVAMTDVVPPIRAGVIDAATGGRRLPEFAAEQGGTIQRGDALLGGRPTILSGILSGGGQDAPLPGELARRWAAVGGQAVALAPPGAPAGPRDVEGRLARWLSDNAAAAVVVRPDRYIYGLASDAAGVQRLVSGLLDQLGARASAASEREYSTP